MLGKRVTMKDIAQKANVHQSTVSLALRNDPRLSQETCRKIRLIAEELGYKPDPALRSLVAYRHMKSPKPAAHTIGLILDLHSRELYAENESYVTLLESAKIRASEMGYTVDVFWYGMDYHNSQSLDRVLKARGIQGVILGAFFHPETRIDIDWNDYSVVKINLLPLEVKADAILSNQMFSVRVAMEKLCQAGFKRIGMAVNDLDDEQNLNMFTAGYFTSQRTFNIPLEDCIEPLIFTRKAASEIFEELKNWILRERLDAFLCNWNNVHQACLKAYAENGHICRFVPLDMDSTTTQYSGINTHHKKIGANSVDMLVYKLTSFIRGFAHPPMLSLVDPEWIESEQIPLSSNFPAPETAVIQ